MSPSDGKSTKGGAGKRKKASRPQRKTTSVKGPPRKTSAGEKPPKPEGPEKPPKPEQPKKDELDVPRETVVKRVEDVRRLALVALAGRAMGGALVTFLMAFVVLGIALIPFRGIRSFPVDIIWGSAFLPMVSVPAAAVLLIGARLAAVRSIPKAASKLTFLEALAFVWADPFREERPHLLPGWLEAFLWAPSQVLAGAVPLLAIRDTGPADAEAACDVARGMVESSELDFTEGVVPGSAEARGLSLLLLLRLARLVIQDGRLKGKISGLGHAALFEGTVG